MGRNIRLNYYGKTFYEYAKSVLETLDNAKERINELQGKMHTTFSLYTNVSLSWNKNSYKSENHRTLIEFMINYYASIGN